MVEKLIKLNKVCPVPKTCEICNMSPIATSITVEENTPVAWVCGNCAQNENEAAERGYYRTPPTTEEIGEDSNASL